MSDPEQQLRDHYERQRLADDRVRAILDAGRAAAARRTRSRWWLTLAAVLAVGLGLFLVQRVDRGSPRAVPATITPQDVATAVADFFARPDYQLANVDSDPAALARWLREQGAPEFSIPARLANLPSFGCQVLQVRDQRVYLICFFLDVSPDEIVEGMMVKPEMVVTAPDGSMMKKTRPLAHLVVAPAAAFVDPPQPGERVTVPGPGEWNFATWAEGRVVYVVAAEADANRVGALVRPL